EQQGNQEVVNQLKKDILQAKIQAENWGTSGSTKRAVDAITNAGLIALSGGSSQSIATAAASPYVNQLIKKATEDYPALNIPTHILWGAVEAELMGGKASTGAISTAAGELGAKYLTEHLYNKEAKDLTETERSQVKEMAKALAGVAGGLAAAGQGSSAVKILSESSIGTTVANNAVENNYLKPSDLVEAERKYKACKGDSDCEMRVVEETNELSKKRNQELDEYRQSLERELLAAKRSAEQQCAGNTDCYLAYSQEANKHFKEQLNAYLAHVSEGKDFESLARNYYPDDAYFRSIWYGLTNSGPQKTKESLKSAKDYIDNTSFGEALDDTLRIGKKLVRLPKEWIEQDIPAHSVEKALREMTDGNPQDVGEVFFGLTTGAATVSVAGKTMKWIGGKWVRSPDVDYSRDNANLGINRNKGLNERISNRQKDFYLNEQNLNREAKELVKNIKLPISDKVLEKHIINGEPKGNFFKGGHTTLGNVKVEKVIKEYANGVYEAKVSIPNPRALKDPNAKPFLEKSGKEKDSVSTMFPRTWTQDRLRVELEYAFKNGRLSEEGERKGVGTTRSGVEVEWFFDKKGNISTVYPVRGQ
ncbi:EndoU domain-containing protein, partial [Haemophilus sp. C1]